MSDDINNPAHYTAGRTIEPIDIVEDWGLGFHLGNALKYLARVGRKDDAAKDLRKLVWYAERELARLEMPRLDRDDIRVGDRVRCVNDESVMLVVNQLYDVCVVSRGEDCAFVVLEGMPARYWDVKRFEVAR